MSVFPVIDPFEKFLGSLTRFAPQDQSFESLLIAEKRIAVTHQNERYSISEQKIWYKKFGKFDIKSARGIIKRALDEKKHPVSNEIIDSILLLFTYNPSRKNGNIEALEEIIGMIQKVSLSQYFIVSKGKFVEGFEDIEFGSFRIGKLDKKKFAYRCKRATSNYFKLYKERLENAFVIERDFFDVNVIAWQNLLYKYNFANKKFYDHLLVYFENLSRLLFEDFWEKFVEEQFLQIAFGIDYIEDKIFRKSLDSEVVSIYSNIKAFNRKVGYVVPENFAFVTLDFNFNFNRDIKKIHRRLSVEYSFKKFTESEIHKTIQSFIKFNSKAYIHFYEGKIDEAFLHFVISLDLIFGVKGESVQSVSKRVAVLTYKSFNVSFIDQKRTLQKIYDTRSKYVHEGKHVDVKQLDLLKKICRFILEILFKVQSQPGYQEKESFYKWLKDLDFVISSLEAGRTIPEKELNEIGIYKNELPQIKESVVD